MFIRESPAKLRRIPLHFRAELGLEAPVAPVCNAPWVSAVVESDGTVRPCFFHPPIGRIGPETTLLDVWGGPEAVAFRNHLEVETNAICRRCVCSLNWTGTAAISG
ncbi:MAG: SPASM domain-containing protein [Acidobacteria bacterium]|nr:SPASM domain-containing protein [Acidobacteriota bacterium]